MHTVPSELLANRPGSMCEKWVQPSERSFLGLHSSTVVNDDKLYMDVYGSLSCKDFIQAAEMCAVSTKQIIPNTGPLFIATESVLVLPLQTNLKTWLPGSLSPRHDCPSQHLRMSARTPKTSQWSRIRSNSHGNLSHLRLLWCQRRLPQREALSESSKVAGAKVHGLHGARLVDSPLSLLRSAIYIQNSMQLFQA